MDITSIDTVALLYGVEYGAKLSSLVFMKIDDIRPRKEYKKFVALPFPIDIGYIVAQTKLDGLRDYSRDK